MPPQFENNNVPPANTEKYPRDHSILIILIIVMLLSGTGAVWYILNLPPEPTPQPITKVDQFSDTTDWQIYRNEELGFEFRYIDKWEILEEKRDGESKIRIGKIGDQGNTWLISEMEVFHSKTKTLAEIPTTFLSKDDIILQKHLFGGLYVEAKTLPMRYIFLYNPELNIAVQFTGVPEQNKDFNNLLSTFKFISTSTSAIDTTNWKLYKNKEIGVQYMYPHDWYIIPSLSRMSIATVETSKLDFTEYKYGWLSVYKFASNTPESPEELVDNLSKEADPTPYNVTSVTVAGYPAVKAKFSFPGGTSLVYFVKVETDIYQVSTGSKEHEPYYQEILNTLKFTK